MRTSASAVGSWGALMSWWKRIPYAVLGLVKLAWAAITGKPWGGGENR